MRGGSVMYSAFFTKFFAITVYLMAEIFSKYMLGFFPKLFMQRTMPAWTPDSLCYEISAIIAAK